MLTLVVFSALLALGAAAPSSPFVVNGTDANIEDYPWMVSIRVFGSHNCGGSIINSKWILTAAHCSGDSVQFGSDRLGSNPDSIVSAKKWVRHENYSDWTLEHDVALIELDRALNFSARVQPTKLPKQWFEVPGTWDTPVTLTGFGLDKTGGSIQNRLQNATLYTVDNPTCKGLHSNTVYNGMLCAGIRSGGRGQCSGDSGGPLVMGDKTQVGIVSWSMKPCTVAPYPGVYTKVSHYVDWIKAHAK